MDGCTDQKKSKLEAQYNRYLISSEDFLEAQGFLNHYSKTSDLTVQRALIIAAIISYSRPFTDNASKEESSDKNASRYIGSQLLKHMNSEEKEVHNKIRNDRNLAIAHSSYAKNPCERHGEASFLSKHDPLSLTLKFEVQLFIDLCDKMAYQCIRKKIKLEKDLASI